jgi:putative component of toxin-antitoxin plasmid stabilization module
LKTFTLIEIDAIDGRIKFYKLFYNSTCEFEDFWNEHLQNSNLKGELIKIQTTMQQISEMKLLPEQKFRDITPKNDTVKEYEIKTKHLRVYCFHQEKFGRIVVTGGIKSNKQQGDINRFRSIKREYLESRKNEIPVVIIK